MKHRPLASCDDPHPSIEHIDLDIERSLQWTVSAPEVVHSDARAFALLWASSLEWQLRQYVRPPLPWSMVVSSSVPHATQ
jgi:hypothetical protein